MVERKRPRYIASKFFKHMQHFQFTMYSGHALFMYYNIEVNFAVHMMNAMSSGHSAKKFSLFCVLKLHGPWYALASPLAVFSNRDMPQMVFVSIQSTCDGFWPDTFQCLNCI